MPILEKNVRSFFRFLLFMQILMTGRPLMASGPVRAQVKEVLVYASGARIISQGSCILQKGYQEIRIEKVSPYLDESSIQFCGKADFLVMSVSAGSKAEEDESKDPALKSLKDSLKAGNDRMKLIQNQQTALQEELAMIKANQKLNSGNTTLSVAELEKAAAFFRIRVEGILNRDYELENQRNLWWERVKAIHNKIQEIQQSGSSPRFIMVGIQSNHSGAAEFELAYLVTNAGWTPQYDILASSNSSKVEIKAKARIWQNTGENWNGVKLSLSTGNPVAGGQIPAFSPYYLSIRNPVRVESRRSAKAMEAPAAAQAMSAYANEQAMMKTAEARSSDISTLTENQENAVNNIFEIDIPYSVRSDGKPVTADIQKFGVPARFQYMVRPRQEKAAFLEAGLVDWGKSGMISGEANVYLDNQLSGNTILDAGMADDTLSISLGRDQNISVERKLTKFLNDKNFTGSEKSMEIQYEIRIKNRKNADSELVVEDQIPLSPNAEAEVSLLESSGAQYVKETGLLRWKNRLKGGESATYKFGFKIRYPKSMLLDTRF
jgi:uncharacterized protein (TIGR02231 family)